MEALYELSLSNQGKSTGGYVFMCNGGLISYKSGRQPTVTQSTAEAEYTAAALAAKEAAFIANMTDELLHFKDDVRPITLFDDNESSILMSHKPGIDGRTKHINAKWHYINQEQANGGIKLQ